MGTLFKLRKDPPFADSARDADLLPLAILLWMGSAVRVGYALYHHEVFGTEATLALACMALIPWLIVVTRRQYRRAGDVPAKPAVRRLSAGSDACGRVIRLRVPVSDDSSTHAGRAVLETTPPRHVWPT